MQELLSDNLWPALAARSQRAKSRRAAIAYVTVDHLGLRAGDQLVVDASALAIRSGETNAKLLRTLHRKGVELYSRPGLHAKVALLDDVAFVSSANLSASSAKRLDEAGVLTDDPSTVASTQALLSRWVTTSQRLTSANLAELVRLPVSPRRGPSMEKGARVRKSHPQGGRVWIVGLRELSDEAHPSEREALQEGVRRAEERRQHPRSEISWVRWTGKTGFGAECAPGDIVFQIMRLIGRKRVSVLQPATVLHVEKEPTCRRVHLEAYPGRMPERMTLRQFRQLLPDCSAMKRAGPGSSRILQPEVGTSAIRTWKSFRT